MSKLINNILIPLTENNLNLHVINQVSYLLIGNNATIFLLYTASTPVNFWRRIFYSRKRTSQWRKEFALFIDFKNQVQLQLGLKVRFRINWGNYKKSILNYAQLIHAHTIILKDDTTDAKWFRLKESPTAYLIRKCSCQIITLFNDNKHISNWKNVVLPVTSFIPQIGIQTIINAAKAFNIKIHLIGTDQSTKGFYFLTETLKIFKSTGNIKVECQYLETKENTVKSFLHYCHLVNADAFLTSVQMLNALPKASTTSKIETLIPQLRNRQRPILQL